MDTRENSSSLVGVIACWIALVATLACNWLAETMRLGGVTTAEVSNQVFAWFAPAGYVFAIWGVIYGALAIWMIAETVRVSKGRALSGKQAVLFVLSCALNIGWLVAFHFQMIAISLAVMAVLWVDLLLLYVSMRDDLARTRLSLAPLSLYFGWINVALIANATNLAVRYIPSSLLVDQISTVALALVALVVGFLSVRNSRDLVFPLVILWAVVGVGVHLMNVDFMVSTALFVMSGLAAIAFYLPPLVAGVRAPKHARAGEYD